MQSLLSTYVAQASSNHQSNGPESISDVMGATKSLEVIVHDLGQLRDGGSISKLPEDVLSSFVDMLNDWVCAASLLLVACYILSRCLRGACCGLCSCVPCPRRASAFVLDSCKFIHTSPHASLFPRIPDARPANLRAYRYPSRHCSI